MKHIPVLPTPTLSEVQSRFAAWRKNKKHGRRIPVELWSAAVMLSHKHSIHKISRGLSLSHAELKKRVASAQTQRTYSSDPSRDFIALDMPQINSAECIIEMEHRSGNKMRMHFKGGVDLDLQSFAESFWRKRA